MTKAEVLLWSKLKNRQIKKMLFNRQKIIGNYIVDFYCAKASLVIELDGGQHYSDEGKRKDEIRDKYLESVGLKVLRFSDRELFVNLDGVLNRIYDNL